LFTFYFAENDLDLIIQRITRLYNLRYVSEWQMIYWM